MLMYYMVKRFFRDFNMRINWLIQEHRQIRLQYSVYVRKGHQKYFPTQVTAVHTPEKFLIFSSAPLTLMLLGVFHQFVWAYWYLRSQIWMTLWIFSSFKLQEWMKELYTCVKQSNSNDVINIYAKYHLILWRHVNTVIWTFSDWRNQISNLNVDFFFFL